MVDKRVIILDTSAFISGFDPFSIDDEQYSVPMVRRELTEGSLSHLRFETAAERGRLKVLEPDLHPRKPETPVSYRMLTCRSWH